MQLTSLAHPTIGGPTENDVLKFLQKLAGRKRHQPFQCVKVTLHPSSPDGLVRRIRTAAETVQGVEPRCRDANLWTLNKWYRALDEAERGPPALESVREKRGSPMGEISQQQPVIRATIADTQY